MVANYAHHEIPDEHDEDPCPKCGAKVWFVCEWGDDDYGDDIVPVEPINYENLCDCGCSNCSRVAIYDVSGLFK